MLMEFDKWLEELRQSNDFGGNHPLSEFEKLAPNIQSEILRRAKTKFLYSANHRKVDFYGYLFDALYNAGVSSSNGIEASSMEVVYLNTCRYFPLFDELSFKEQYSIMRDVVMHVGKSNQIRHAYAMRMYYTLVERQLDMVFRTDVNNPLNDCYNVGYTFSKGIYKKTYTSFKDLRDADTNVTYKKNIPVWVTYTRMNGNHVLSKSAMCCDMWKLLTE